MVVSGSDRLVRALSSFSAALAAVCGLVACSGKSFSRGDDDAEGGSVNAGGSSGGGKATRGGSGGGGSGGTSNGGTGGGAGEAGDHLVVTRLRQTPVERVDLLLLVDNSIGMDEKQALLSEALPTLVDRLTTPACLNESGSVVAREGDDCPAGSAPQFSAITDLHVGVLTSSLGSHGGTQCTTEDKNDYAQLLASRRPGLSQWNNAGFLSWDPGATHFPEGESDLPTFVDALQAHVLNAGGTGCGYEASLEAWYRFLVDPEPVLDVTNDGEWSVRGPINDVVLAQRDMFLRPDSAVVIVMLTDENDCSIIDEDDTQGWLVGNTGTSQSPFRMPRASASCAGNPNDPCCRMCVQAPAAGCPDDGADAECVKGQILTSTAEDHPNLRCFKHMQRFGLDLLYPTRRYVEGLTSTTLTTRAGVTVPNPLFTPRGGLAARDRSSVVLVGIVGVPWQDVVDPAGFRGRPLRVLTAEELAAPDPALMGHTRWELMLGSPGNFPPMDPHMLEQIDPRPEGAQHPLLSGTEYAIASPGATGRPNAINGHEQYVPGRDDLQYACIFPLRAPIACDPPAAMGNDVACLCNSSEYEYNRPTCSYAGGGESEGVQEYGKATPGVRQLEVLRDLGSQAVVGSICPKNNVPEGTASDDPYYGYNPIVHAVAERFERMTTPGCLPRPLPVNEDGSLACRVVQSELTAACACDAPGRRSLTESEDPEVVAAMRQHLVETGYCGAADGIECENMCLCEIPELEGDAREACAAGAEVTDGFCYVDSGELVAKCPADARRSIRLPSIEFPEGATVNVVCDG